MSQVPARGIDIDQLRRKVVLEHRAPDGDWPDDFKFLVERRCSQHQVIAGTGDGALVEGAGMHVCSTELIAPLKMTIYACSEAVPRHLTD
jgi:hypothetical protein